MQRLGTGVRDATLGIDVLEPVANVA